jgi:hypothetical protein
MSRHVTEVTGCVNHMNDGDIEGGGKSMYVRTDDAVVRGRLSCDDAVIILSCAMADR